MAIGTHASGVLVLDSTNFVCQHAGGVRTVRLTIELPLLCNKGLQVLTIM